MHSAIALTLFFASATSLLGARRSAHLATATRQPRYWIAVALALSLAVWMAFCGAWLLTH